MINLIPPEALKRAKTEYFLRVGGTFAFLFGAVALLVGVAHVPTHVLINAQIQTLQKASAENKDRDAMIEVAETEARNSKNLIAQLRILPQGLQTSKVIAEVQNENPGAIDFNRFTIKTENSRVTQVLVQGVAPTRSVLAQYKVSLESNPLFVSAEVPIADLARDVDLPFVMTITLAEDV